MDINKLMDCIKNIGVDNFIEHIAYAQETLDDTQFVIKEFYDEVNDNVNFNRTHYGPRDVSILIGTLSNVTDEIDLYNLINRLQKAFDVLSEDLKRIQEVK